MALSEPHGHAQIPFVQTLCGNPGPTHQGLAVSCCHHRGDKGWWWRGMEPPWHLIVGVSFWAWIFLLATVLPPPTLLSYNEAFPFQNLPPYLAPVDCTDCNTKSGSCPTQRFLPSYLKLTLRSKGLGMGEGDLKEKSGLISVLSHLLPQTPSYGDK